jgi:hypothetical protein
MDSKNNELSELNSATVTQIAVSGDYATLARGRGAFGDAVVCVGEHVAISSAASRER